MAAWSIRHPTLRRVGDRALDALVFVVVFVVVIIAYSRLAPSAEQNALNNIEGAARAQVCVLALPVTDDGRDPADVQRCLTENGL